MGDPSHIIELIDRILDETAEQPALQEKIFDLRDILLQTQQEAQQCSLKIKTLEDVIQKLKSPAHRIGIILGPGVNGLHRLCLGGQEYQAAASPEIKEELRPGDVVALNEGFVAIFKLPLPAQGTPAKITSRLADGQWLLTAAGGNTEIMAVPRHDLDTAALREGDEVLLDSSQKIILSRLPKREAKSCVEDNFNPVEWNQVGGQGPVIEQVRKVIEYPLLHSDLMRKMQYQLPKGFLFYGPPGCGKTLVGRAILTDIVNQLRQQGKKDAQGRFIHIKGPEILNMWLGESEKNVREIFRKAREYKEKGQIPFIFIDEAEAILGTRQAWRGHNITNTLVPMFCAEMDGIQSLADTVVILATNRPDLIDPAILRPGRIDRKIKVGRPDRAACADILRIYLNDQLPLEREFPAMAELFLDKLFAKSPAQEVLLLSMKNGSMKHLYWKDFISGAIIEGIVKRAKEMAIERAISGSEPVISAQDLLESLEREFNEGKLLPAESNMEDWLQLLDIEPRQIARVRRPGSADAAAALTASRSMI